MDPALLQKIQTAIVHNNASRYVSVAGWTVLVWDHLITIADEVKFIWKAPSSTVKFLFLFNRYVTLACLSITIYEMSGLTVYPSQVCHIWKAVCGIIEVTCAGVARVLILLRVYALWERRRWVGWTLTVVFICSNTFIAICTLMSVFEVWDQFYWSNITRSCALNRVPPLLFGVWVTPVAVETIVFVMTMIKAIQHWKAEQIQTPLLQSLYRDSILFFFGIMVLRVFALLVWAVMPVTLLALGLNFFWGLNTTMVNRILLSLRHVGSADDWGRATALFSDERPPITAMRFADLARTTMGFTTQWTTRRDTTIWTTDVGEEDDKAISIGRVDEESPPSSQTQEPKGKEVEAVQ